MSVCGRDVWRSSGCWRSASAGCQALKDALPTKSTEPTPAPSQAPVAIPVVLPQPTPTPVLGGPTPTPSPSPSSTPAPAPTPTPGAARRRPAARAACRRATTPTRPARCRRPSFLNAVDKAITQLTQQQPSIFDFNNKLCENCYYVKDEAAFVAGVIKNLNAAGMCALLRRRGARGEELELLQRAVRHPDLLGPHPPRRRLLPQHLQPVLVLSAGAGGAQPGRSSPSKSGSPSVRLVRLPGSTLAALARL